MRVGAGARLRSAVAGRRHLHARLGLAILRVVGGDASRMQDEEQG